MIRPTLFFLHALGSSGREWDEVIAALGPDFDCVALDLPGFGDNAASQDTGVAQMVDWLARIVQKRDPATCLLVGHSMGGKIVTILAAMAENGTVGLPALNGVVLIAASPPAPEPIDDDRRAQMIGWFADGPASDEQARGFLNANTASALSPWLMERALADIHRSRPRAWLDWLETGSREDWSERVGYLTVPALIIAGGKDGDLDEAAQRRLNAPHYRDCHIRTVPDAAHLLPYEQPDAIARLIAEHWTQVKPRD